MLYLPEEIYRFVGALRDLTTIREHRSKTVSIPEAERSLRLSTENLVRIILNSRISMAADDPSNARFNNFHVSICTIKKTFLLDEREFIRPARAAEILRINKYTVHALISVGILRSALVREYWSNRSRVYACPNSMRGFDVKYASLTYLAEESGRSTTGEAVLQRGNGSYPLSLGRKKSLIFERRKSI